MREIFIFAQTRSGSTLLQRAINQTPDVLIYGEHSGMLDRFADAYYDVFDGGFTNFEPEKLRDKNAFLPCLSCITPGNFAWNLREFIEDTLNPAHVARWGFKEVRYKSSRSRAFGTAQFVFLVRDPREQVQSIRSVPWGDKASFCSSLNYWADTFFYFAYCAQKYSDRCVMIHYDQLRDVRKLFRWLELGNGLKNLFKEMPRTGATENKKPFTREEQEEMDRSQLVERFLDFKWGYEM
jgi:hypothetical protein